MWDSGYVVVPTASGCCLNITLQVDPKVGAASTAQHVYMLAQHSTAQHSMHTCWHSTEQHSMRTCSLCHSEAAAFA
jgi:hypothetical protein